MYTDNKVQGEGTPDFLLASLVLGVLILYADNKVRGEGTLDFLLTSLGPGVLILYADNKVKGEGIPVISPYHLIQAHVYI